jgi:hypothetical protein
VADLFDDRDVVSSATSEDVESSMTKIVSREVIKPKDKYKCVLDITREIPIARTRTSPGLFLLYTAV